jgi:hypothetical protein
MKPEMQRIASFPMKTWETMRSIQPIASCCAEREAMRPVDAANGWAEGSA